MGEFATIPLERVARMFSGGTPSKADSALWRGSVPWLTPKDMGQWNGSTEETVSHEAIGKGTRLAPHGAIFIAVRGMSLHNEIRIVRSDAALTFNQDVKAIVPNDGTDGRFLYYALFAKKQDLLESVEAAGHGTGRLPTDKLRSIGVPDISPAEQSAIASYLGALDDKIDLNRRMNGTLEGIVRAIFKDWFVDFGPTRAKAEGSAPYLAPEIWALFPARLDDDDKPEGWKYADIYTFSNVVYGAPFASKQFNSEQRGLPLIRIRDLADHQPVIFTDEIHPKAQIIEPGDIVAGMDGEFRLHVWKGPKALLNQRMCNFRPKQDIPASYLAEALKEPLSFFERGKVGTTVIHLGKGDIDTFRLLQPPPTILKAYGAIAEPLLRRIVTNSRESIDLAQTRDLLLPKLMSGEIRLREAEKIVEAAA
jgi:type I restriction enzyme, S subunit